jgi:hypothetical protein
VSKNDLLASFTLNNVVVHEFIKGLHFSQIFCKFTPNVKKMVEKLKIALKNEFAFFSSNWHSLG